MEEYYFKNPLWDTNARTHSSERK